MTKIFTGTTTPAEITKQPREKYPFAVDYTDNLAEMVVFDPSVTLDSATFEVHDETGATVTSTILVSPTATINSGAYPTVMLQNGTSGQSYRVTCLATFSNGAILEDDTILRVQAR